MKNVYDESYGYTDEAFEFENKIRYILKDIIREELEKGSAYEAIEYVMHNAIHVEMMKQKMCIRTGRDVYGNKEEDTRF